MTSVRDQIEALLRKARVERDEPTRNVIGMIKNKVLVALKSGSGVQAYAKEVQKAIRAYEEVGEQGATLLAEARFELAFCEQFLPKRLDEAATAALLRALATEHSITDPKQAGKLVGLLMKTHREVVDPAIAKKAAEAILGG
jgi:uncharacterized protein YqeY